MRGLVCRVLGLALRVLLRLGSRERLLSRRRSRSRRSRDRDLDRERERERDMERSLARAQRCLPPEIIDKTINLFVSFNYNLRLLFGY